MFRVKIPAWSEALRLFFVVFLSSSRRMLALYLVLCQRSFLPQPSQSSSLIFLLWSLECQTGVTVVVKCRRYTWYQDWKNPSFSCSYSVVRTMGACWLLQFTVVLGLWIMFLCGSGPLLGPLSIIHPTVRTGMFLSGGMGLTGKNRRTGERPFSVPLRLPQVPHGLPWALSRASALRTRRQTSWAFVLPSREAATQPRELVLSYRTLPFLVLMIFFTVVAVPRAVKYLTVEINVLNASITKPV
jgi:hypothetical protein